MNIKNMPKMNIEKGTIALTGMRFYAAHGVLPQERTVGGEYRVNLRIEYPLSEAVTSDSVEDTLNYADVYHLVEREMAQPSALLEHVAGRIGQRLFDAFPLTRAAVVSVEKLNPPMGADIASAAVELCLINDKTF